MIFEADNIEATLKTERDHRTNVIDPKSSNDDSYTKNNRIRRNY